MAHYFFCGVGGSGMLPLAMIIKGQGHDVSGSDRSYDQGRSPEKFAWILSQGINISPQDGSGLAAGMILVVSSAIEDSIPDVKHAKDLGLTIVKRADLLSSLFNAAKTRIGIAGTSGKSTTTGMVSYALARLQQNPTMMNGAVVRDFVNAENPYATYLNGSTDLFVSEIDESDGSIELYNPTHAVITNIALDHKPMAELIPLFQNYAARAGRVILPSLAAHVDEVVAILPPEKIITFGFDVGADVRAELIDLRRDGVSAKIIASGASAALSINCPGQHNLSNALAAISVLLTMGFSLPDICAALSGFSGIKRRMEVVGTTRNNIIVYDDFAHNPDKITASLKSLKQHTGRLLVLFQMHGFGPLRLMKAELMEAFCNYMDADDRLYMPEVLYLGGTVDRSYTARDFMAAVEGTHKNAFWFETRDEAVAAIIKDAQPDDRIIIMGARDDTLSDVAKFILESL